MIKMYCLCLKTQMGQTLKQIMLKKESVNKKRSALTFNLTILNIITKVLKIPYIRGGDK